MARRYHANDSSAMAGFLAPSRAAGATSARDHVADNVARVAAMEEVVSMRKALAEMPASPPKASSKYDHVTSRLAAAGAMSRPAKPSSPDENAYDSAPVSRTKARTTAAEVPLPRRFERAEVAPRKPSVPTRADALPKPIHETKDFVAMNASTVVATGGAGSPGRPSSPGDMSYGSARVGSAASGSRGGPRAHSASGTARFPGGGASIAGSAAAAAAAAAAGGSASARHSEYGAVPKYLRERQAEWAAAEDARRKAEADKDVPKGMRVMPEGERLDMLAMLREGIAEAKDELSKFRLVLSVPSQIKRRGDLEAKLAQMEEAIGVFSRERVFVKA